LAKAQNGWRLKMSRTKVWADVKLAYSEST